MKNKTIYESLQEYFKNTSKEKVIEDWNEFQHLDNDGITVNEFLENQKQETVKEAAEKFYPPKTTDLICSPKLVRDSFIAGAKWQKEQDKNLYSEEDLLRFAKSCFYKGFDKAENDDANCYTAFREEISSLFQKFKKK